MEGEKLRKGSWLEEEDEQLIAFVTLLGERRWDYIARSSGLKRSGKSCRLRWLNYLRPNIKHGHISTEEEDMIIQLHQQWGNKWSRIARRLPGRTDNEIKNYWKTHLRRKMEARKQESFECGRNNGKQDFLFQKVDFDVQKCDVDDMKPVEEDTTIGTGNATWFDAFTSSPYETRLLDWMTELSSNDQSEIKHQDHDYEEDGDSNNSTDQLYSCYPTMISDDYDIWGWSESIWDMS